MNGYLCPMEKVKRLVEELRRSESKLTSGKRMPMSEQFKVQADIQRLKDEILRLERRVV